jgi:enoyl-CoA hydratase
MAGYSTVLLDIDGAVATLTLNRPDQRNALNLQMCDDLKAAAETVRGNSELRVLLVAANGPAFCGGADLKERENKDADWVRERRRRSYAAYAALAAIEIPMIAIVDGPAAGSGCEIAAICDFIWASDKASFRYPEAQWGTVGATQRLPRLVGKAMAKELLFTNRAILAEEAKAIGLVNRVVPSASLWDDARALAAQIAKGPPLAMKLAKRCIDQGTQTTLEKGIALEQEAVEQSLAGKEWSAGVEAFAKRK